MGMIDIQKTNITQLKTDCIVNAANTHLYSGGGVCGTIFKAAGYEELTEACRTIGYCETGKAVITPAFQLNAKYIIHAVGPIWKKDNQEEAKLLYSCYQNSLELAKKVNAHSIAFPLISSGIYGYPKKEAWEISIQACNAFIDTYPGYDIQIIFAVIDEETLQLGKAILNQYLKEEDLIKQINQDQLKEAIDFFSSYTKVAWTTDKRSLSYPVYPKKVFEYMQLLPADINYIENYQQFRNDITLEDLNIHQIQTVLTMLLRKEKYYDGFMAHYIEDGTILQLLLRLNKIITSI